MMHPCEVQAVGLTWRRVLADLLRYGHIRHECVLQRPAFQNHVGDHRCRCGVTYVQQPGQDGPPPTLPPFSLHPGTATAIAEIAALEPLGEWPAHRCGGRCAVCVVYGPAPGDVPPSTAACAG